MLVSAYDYELPEELIAQHPTEVRGASRMLTLDRRTGAYADRRFTDLPALLQAGDLVVLNDSRVIPARLYAQRAGLSTQNKSPAPTGLIEVLLTEQLRSAGENDWSALVRPARKVQPGETLLFYAAPPVYAAPPAGEVEPALRATVLSAGEFGERTLRFAPVPEFYGVLERIGHLPLPPYIHRPRTAPDTAEDRERYQTVYSQRLAPSPPVPQSQTMTQPMGSAAAPTAGLHFTPQVLDALGERGIEIATVTLHVGLGTFQPVRVNRTEDIRLHAEPYTLPAATAAALNRARRDGRRIIAVGTTTTRTLEHIARLGLSTGVPISAHSGSTSLFLSPGPDGVPRESSLNVSAVPATSGHEFHLVSGLLTNFHLPQSTLLMLVSAFAGREHVLAAYAHAVAERYRFFSYGDCMLIL